jgi:uncharacterized protein
MSSAPFNKRDPLHGVTLEQIVNHLVEHYGWEEMARRIPVRCFELDPSVKSSLKFLRQTDWARKKIEVWYIRDTYMRSKQILDPESDDDSE